jgi:hypothetical protein
MRQVTTAKLCLDAGKATRFSVSAQSTGWFDSCCTRGDPFTIAQDAPSGDSGATTHGESGECRQMSWDKENAGNDPRATDGSQQNAHDQPK